MKWALVLCLMLVAGVVGAQAPVGAALGRMVLDAQRQGLLPRDVGPRVLDPAGFAPAPREGVLPPPLSNERELRVVNADRMRRQGDRIEASGRVEFVYRGYQVFAQEVAGDLRTRVFDLSGDVRVFGKGGAVQGARVRVNFETERFRAEDGRAEIRPEFSKGNLIGDLYLRGRETYGDRREFRSVLADLTTCNLDEPHFHVHARELTVRVGRRAILRGAKLIVSGRTLLTVPFLVIPLNRDERYTPEIGQSPDEGYYIKNRFGIPIRGDNLRNTLDARLDYFEKKGAGIGGDYTYSGRSAEGTMRVYGLTGGGQTFETALQHRQQFRFGTLSVEGDYQQNNYLFNSQSRQLNARAELVLPQGTNQTRFTLNRSTNDSGGFSTEQQTIGLDDTRTLFKSLRTSLQVDWVNDVSRFLAGSASQREQIDVRFRGTTEFDRATAMLEYQRSVPVGQTSGFFGALERTPVFTLSSDARRLLGNRLAERLPFTTEISHGQFRDFASRRPLSRTNFALDFSRPGPFNRRLRVDLNGRFQQGMYSDGTAQYITQLGVNGVYRLGPDTALNVRFNYNMPFGFSPLQLDRTGRASEINADLSIRPLRSLLLAANTGYDLIAGDRRERPWQFVAARATYTPYPWLGMRATSTYDTTRRSWSNLRLDFAYRPGETFVGVGLRYDGFRQVWGNANLFVDGLKMGRLKVTSLLAYNGFQRRFESRQYSFTYDTHDAEFVLQVMDNPVGFRSGREITFFIRLKALPFDTPFGIGRRGQPIGTGTGRDF